ncbi:MAG: ABC transporter permease [Proteobacteria bacterium]|nr:ABC transporter permease [Pseudomonadota bacterium]MBI3499786.1 ABC transporter permease [Pseudomonadota bacterium]
MQARLFGKAAKMAIGGTIIAAAAALALLAPWIAPFDPYQQDLLARLKPPFWSVDSLPQHWLGTDNLGRDLLSRLIYGSRLSMTVGVAAAVLSCALGSVAGLLAGYRGGRLEQLVMRLADAHLAFPEILLAILIAAAIGGSAINLILVLGISGWMIYARVAFGLARTLKERAFIEAAVSYGASDWAILFRHLLPQMVPVLTVIATLQVAQMILQETALSFLGLGLPPPTATWGNMLAEGRDRLWVAPWIANLAGLAIIIVVWGVNMLGQGLREHLDPKSRGL